MKILFFDIDGTLVSFKTHVIPQSAVDEIERAHDLGHKIIIATGRPMAIINNLGQLQSRGLIDGYVTMNGACCMVDGKVLFRNEIPAGEAASLASLCDERGCPCIFVGEHSLTIAGADLSAIQLFAKGLGAPPIPVTDYAKPLLHPLFQLTPFFSSDVQACIEPLMPGSEFARWHPAFVDITARGCNKAQGVNVMLEHFGMQRADAIAFGDGGNDAPMLRHAGIGVAMGNAADDVKAAADMVTEAVDDNGLANAIKKLI